MVGLSIGEWSAFGCSCQEAASAALDPLKKSGGRLNGYGTRKWYEADRVHMVFAKNSSFFY